MAVGGICLALTGCLTPPGVEEGPVLRVSAAVSLSDALAVAARAFQQETGLSVVVNAAGSDTLATQIVAGAPVDLFVSADDRQMDRVDRLGLIQRDSRVVLCSNTLVAVAREETARLVRDADDLRDPRIRRLAIGDPASVPAGVYAQRYLDAVGVWPAVAPKITPTRSVRAALAAVDGGHADVGLVYATDLVASDELVVVFEVPPEAGPPIVYPAAVLTAARHRAEAHRLLRFLHGPVGQRVLRDAGFRPVDDRGGS